MSRTPRIAQHRANTINPKLPGNATRVQPHPAIPYRAGLDTPLNHTKSLTLKFLRTSLVEPDRGVSRIGTKSLEIFPPKESSLGGLDLLTAAREAVLRGKWQ